MARIDNLTNFLTDVATSIKAKTEDNTPIPASQFDTKIAGITTGKLSNGEYTKANNNLDEILYQSQNVLPDTYQQVEYLESTGTQYIDTRVEPTINTKARVKFAPIMSTSIGYFGARLDPKRFCCTTFEFGKNFAVGMSVNTWPANRTIISYDTIYDCVFGNGYANINGTNYTETVYSSFGEAGSFKLAYLGSEKSYAKYYLCQMWENDILIFYGIPCYRKLDDKPGMYDTVNNVFYTNEGTGDFIVGADVDVLNSKIESVLTEKNTKIIPGNIKKDINILGVTGTYEGGGSSNYNAQFKPLTSSDRQVQKLLTNLEPLDISNVTDISYVFYFCSSLLSIPEMDTSGITNATYFCHSCSSLVNVPVYDFSSLTGTNNSNLFANCPLLSNDSLNNILATCLTMTGVTNKTLKYIGLSSTQATTCQGLSNWSSLSSAGWTTGY